MTSSTPVVRNHITPLNFIEKLDLADDISESGESLGPADTL
jgi:hypothetical protein